MAQFIRIVEWETYQHYKDRNPPWIKLHRGTLTSNTWVSLDDASRVLAVAIMLLAAERGNRIPAKPDYLKRVAYLHTEPNLRPLVEVGFIEIVEENGEPASSALATARPERETEQIRAEKKEVEARVARSPSKRGSRLPEDWSPSPACIAFAEKLGINWTSTLPAFRDHWTAATGQKATKLDWDAAWRTWCRNEIAFSQNRKPEAREKGAYVAMPANLNSEEKRLSVYADMIAKGMNPGINFGTVEKHKLLKSGRITPEQLERAGCAA